MAKDGDKPVGVAGIIHTTPLQAFSVLDFDTKENARFIVEVVREFRELLRQYEPLPVYAIPATDRDTAAAFLRYVGFEKIEDGLFRWATPYQ